MNFHKNVARPVSRPIHDEEAHAQPIPDPDTSTTTTSPQRSGTSNPAFCSVPPSATPPVTTRPLRVDTLPKDFEPKPQKQEYYLSLEEATEAGIEPPTPIFRAQMVARKMERERQNETGPGSSRKGNDAVLVKHDGRVVREV